MNNNHICEEELISQAPIEFISLGSLCLPASLLQLVGFRNHSYPFDWVFSGGECVAKSLKSSFSDWLRPELLFSHSPYRRCGHVEYHESFYNHHDPTLEVDRIAYERRISRFLNLNQSTFNLVYFTTITLTQLVGLGIWNLLPCGNSKQILILNLQAASNNESSASLSLVQNGIYQIDVFCKVAREDGEFTNGIEILDKIAQEACLKVLSDFALDLRGWVTPGNSSTTIFDLE